MTVTPPMLRRLVAVIVLSLGAPVAAIPLAGAAAPGAVGVGDARAADCASPLLAVPRPAAEVRSERPAAFAEAVDRAGHATTSLRELSRDDSVWLDRCGAPYFVEPVHEQAHEGTAAATATALTPGTDVFDLESDPGAPLTIYLDFRGERVTGTPWNWYVGADPLVAAPMSLDDRVDTDFSAAELEAIHQAWLVVSEDFSPFAVNVTTRDPGAEALRRSSLSDTSYGARVLVSTGGPVGTTCGCGGLAYPGVFDDPSSAGPVAWVFADALRSGWNIGDAASHETGHLLGLKHDGTATSDYYRGHDVWGPIMGVAYHRPLSQWSQGEYAGASNTEDDLAIIADSLSLRPDDHGDVASSATDVPVGGGSRGVIGHRTDVDAFAFVGSGVTTVEVAHPSRLDTDLDLRLTVLDPTGQVVETVDPQPAPGVGVVAHPVDAVFAASWTAQLPEDPTRYTVLVEGAGSVSDGSDYGSLGRYEVLVTPGPPAGQLALAGPEGFRVGRGRDFEWTGLSVSGGVEPYTWSAQLPAGVAIDPASGRLTGRVDQVGPGGAVAGYVQVRDSRGVTDTHWLSLQVEQVTVPAQPQSFEVGAPVDIQLQATGLAPLAWAVDGEVDALPPGLALSVDGVLSGVPTEAGTWSLPVRVSNGWTDTSSTVQVVVAHRPPSFSTRRLDRGRVGRRYVDVVRLDDVVGTIRWRVSGGLPPGLTLHPTRSSAAARVVGIPERGGRYRFTLRARDRATGLVAERAFRLRVVRR